MGANEATLDGLASSAAQVSHRETRCWEKELTRLSARPAQPPAAVEEARPGLSVAHGRLRELLADPEARQILEEQFPGILDHPQLWLALNITLRECSRFVPQIMTEEKLQAVDEALSLLEEV